METSVGTAALAVLCLLSTVSAGYTPRLLVISFDGFRWDYILRPEVPYLRSLSLSGSMASQLTPTFITKTFPNHATLATGLYQENHGVVGNEFYDPHLNDTFHVNRHESYWWTQNPTAVPLWIENQLINPSRRSASMMWPGGDATYRNVTANRVVRFNESIPWAVRIDTIVQWMTDPIEPINCVFAYFEEPDATAHKYGTQSTELSAALRRVDVAIGSLLRELSDEDVLDVTNIVIVSDHGMMDIPSEHVIEMDTFLDPSLYTVYGWSPVLHILPKPGQEDRVYATLLNASQFSNFTVLKRNEIPDEYHYKNNDRVMPMIVISDEGWDILPRRYYNHSTPFYGNHGYNNSLPSMQGIFIGHGPQFTQKREISVMRNIDVYPLLCYILRVEPHPHNGSLEVGIPLLQYPPEKDLSPQLLIGALVFLLSCIITGVLAAIYTRGSYPHDALYRAAAAQPRPDPPSTRDERQHLLLANS